LELLFEVNEYFEEFMPDNAKIKLVEKPTGEQASQLPPKAYFRDKNKLLNFPLIF